MKKEGQEATKYCGIIPPLLTPLQADETLDEESFEKIIEYCIKNGVSGLFTMGTTGEAVNVSRKVWKQASKFAISTVKGRVPVFSGVIDSSTARVIENIKELEDSGASIVVVSPFFYLQNTCQDEIIRHYEQICRATDLKVVVYNIPSTTHANILPETMLELSKIDNIVAYKDSCADFEQFQRNLFLMKDASVSILNGAEELCAASMLFGADGCIPGLANLFPRVFVSMYEATLKRDLDRAFELQKQVWEIRKILFAGKSWLSGMKYAAQRLHLCSEKATSPIEPLQFEEKKKIERIIDQYCSSFI